MPAGDIKLISIVVIAVASFAYLAWTLRHIWKYQQWADDSGAEHGSSPSESQTNFKGYSREECYRYCVEHPYLTSENPALNCAAVCAR